MQERGELFLFFYFILKTALITKITALVVELYSSIIYSTESMQAFVFNNILV
jgi:hypothetical protein